MGVECALIGAWIGRKVSRGERAQRVIYEREKESPPRFFFSFSFLTSMNSVILFEITNQEL